MNRVKLKMEVNWFEDDLRLKIQMKWDEVKLLGMVNPWNGRYYPIQDKGNLNKVNCKKMDLIRKVKVTLDYYE